VRWLTRISSQDPLPILKALQADESLIPLRLAQLDQLSTEALVQSLAPGQRDCLKTRRDGTIIDGHHHVYIPRRREVNVDALPHEILLKEDL